MFIPITAIPIHSQTDVITNSSTTIYTHSDKSADACKEMINAILKTFRIDKTCDDIFKLFILYDSVYSYKNWITENNYDTNGDLDILFEKIKQGIVDKPKWMYKADIYIKRQGNNDGSTLYIIPQSPEYTDIANLIFKFLYSTQAIEGQN